MYRFAVLLTLCSTLAFLPATARAAHPLITDDTGTQGKGKYQLEVNGQSGWSTVEEGGVSVRENSGNLAAALTAGLTETVDLVVGIPWDWHRENGPERVRDTGFDDLTLELKWRFWEVGKTSLAVKPHLSFPTGDDRKGFGTGRVSGALSLIGTTVLEPVTLHVNAGYRRNEFARDEDRAAYRDDAFFASAAGTLEVLKGLQVVGNVGTESPAERGGGSWASFALGGLIWSATESLDLDCGMKFGLTKAEEDITVLAGMTLRF